MDSTATILEKLDGTTFERFCGPVLRKKVPELANFIPSGINESGKTIKSLMDGFCFIGSKHMATVYITTTNEKDLTTKWLYDGDAPTMTKGDLIKGINHARKIHEESPSFKFSIFLVHNSRVDDALHLKVHQRNTDSYIEVTIIEQRDLVLFLDLDPEGQYLRQKLLNINADRLSMPLLKEVALSNLRRYGREYYLKESYLANVSSQNKMKEQLDASPTVVNLLTGDSGFGKSAFCFMLMREIQEKGGIAYRLDPSVIEQAISIESAILQQLKIDSPSISARSMDVRELFQNAMIVVDDINNYPNSSTILDKLISWGGRKKTEGITLLCPVWRKNMTSLRNKEKKESHYTVISIGRFSFNDCKSIIKSRNDSDFPVLTEQQIHSLIIGSGFDPLLLDLSLQQLSNSKEFSERAAGKALEIYFLGAVQQLCTLHAFPIYSINQVLASLGRAMLKNRKIDPHLNDIEKWFDRGSEDYKIVTLVAAQRELFSFDDTGKCFFRHDRVRDYLLTRAATTLFQDFISNEDVLADPYFSEIVGAALATSKIQKERVEWLLEANPLAVYISLKYFPDEVVEFGRNLVIEKIVIWSAAIATHGVPKTVTSAIAGALVGFDVKEIIRITKGFPSSIELELAKFRNGEWLSGVKFFSFARYFYPEAPTYWWNTILAHVKAKYLKEIVEKLCLFLPANFTDEGITHAYTLIGFLREPCLLEVLSNSWQKYASPKHYVAFLWAILKCFTKNDQKIVTGALSYWATIRENDRRRPLQGELSSRAIDSQLKFLDWDFSEEQLTLLIDLSGDSSLRGILSLLFAKIDHPTAFGVVLDIEMNRDSPHHWHDDWDGRWDWLKTKYRLGEASLQYLLSEFLNTNSNPIRRYIAWRYWTGNAEETVALKKLQEIEDESDSLFDESVIWRVEHGDETAAGAIITMISRKPWLVRVLCHIWNEETRKFFTDWFHQRVNGSSYEEVTFGLELFVLLDNDDASRLLLTHWERLKFHTRAIETALFLSTPATKAVADQEIRRLGFEPLMPEFYRGNINGVYISEGDGLSKKKKDDLLLLGEHFKYMYLHYGFKSKTYGERITREKLETLLPYLPLFDSMAIYHFALDCLRIGALNLCYEKFYPAIKEPNLRNKIRLTTDELTREIIYKYETYEKDNTLFIDHWIEQTHKLGVTNEMLFASLKSFSASYHTERAFFIIAVILEDLGTRQHIEILDSFVLDAEQDVKRVAYWKANTIFAIKRRTLE